MSPRHARSIRPLLAGSAIVLASALPACGSGEAAAPSAASSAARATAPVARSRARDPELAEVRAALEKGRADIALALLERVQGFEAECLRARALVVRGDSVGGLAAIERARALDGEHPELFATEAECLATLDRIQGAADVLIRGFQHGSDPALYRAQGVIELRNQGHGE